MALCEEMERYAKDTREEVLQLVRTLCAIPAPSNHEERRAEFCRKWFQDNGFKGVEIDPALNVLAPVNISGQAPFTVVMAHTDTVFPEIEPMPLTEKDGFLHCPGAGDDTANLAVMMVCARYYREHAKPGMRGILFVANAGEEGLGNLKGSRLIVDKFHDRILEFVSLDAFALNTVCNKAVGSHRYKVRVRTEGGHSFSAFGNRNAIHVLASMIAMLYTVKVPQEGDSKTTYNVGVISGGTSVNTIAQEAEMLYEYRSDSRTCLEKMQKMFSDTVAAFRSTGAEVSVERIGERPCSGEIDPVKADELLKRFRASVKDCLKQDIVCHSSSTDCNIPLSLGIPAICFGTVRGFGAHTREEKIETASLYDGSRLLLDFLKRSSAIS